MFNLFLAYIDPASGSILLQLILGAIAGVGLFFWQSIGRVFGLLRRRGGECGSGELPPAGDESGC